MIPYRQVDIFHLNIVISWTVNYLNSHRLPGRLGYRFSVTIWNQPHDFRNLIEMNTFWLLLLTVIAGML